MECLSSELSFSPQLYCKTDYDIAIAALKLIYYLQSFHSSHLPSPLCSVWILLRADVFVVTDDNWILSLLFPRELFEGGCLTAAKLTGGS